MRALRWLLPLLSLAVVLWLTWRDVRGGGTGPGPVHPAHAAVAAIAGGAHCESCHEPGAGVDAGRCVRCHSPIAAQAGSGSGLHGRLPAEQFARCERCHPDHHGDSVPLIAPFAFARAGVPEVAAYDHRHVAFTLTGAHTRLQCVSCHPRGDDVVPPALGRWLGLDQRCTTCHDDVHRGAFGGDCAGCHGQERPWPEVPAFRHDTFALAGAHARVGCARSHEPGSARDVAAVRSVPPPVRACGDCHANPHGSLAAAPTALRLPAAADCARCHVATAWAAARPDPERHAVLGFPLRGPHAAAACAACHGDGQRAARWVGATPTVVTCASCHSHPHSAALVAAATAVAGDPEGCAGCHGDAEASFAAGRITPAQHAAGGFALVAPHAEVACAGCHGGATRPARFPGRNADDCRACHRDVHGGQFAPDARYAQCTACHAATHWAPPAFGLTAHAATVWPLAGAHAAVACRSCHREGQRGVRTFRGTPVRCRDCHADVHGGTFDRAGRPARVDGREDCARCHDTVAFAPVAASFDHARWTGWELAGAHRQVACAACHPAGRGRPGVAATRLGQAPGSHCAACHSDPHASQFAVAGRTDCARCHGAAAWTPAQFDHQRDSRFPLDATHRPLACGKCHGEYRAGDAVVVRYRPLGTACGDCHRLGAGGEVRR